MNYSLFSSESVCAGHPDKICDQVSDAVLDAALTADPKSRVACETLVTTNRLVMAGEITCRKKLNYHEIAKGVISSLGYTDSNFMFGPDTDIESYLHSQSADIALGVDDGGAGDQGMMFGYASNETREFMPLPITLAHELTRRLDLLAKKELPYLRPDGKAQVTISYDSKGKAKRVENIVLAKPNDPKVSKKEIQSDLYQKLVRPLLEEYNLAPITESKIIFNGTGNWEIGGPASDTGVTGRKIVVDTYGGMGRLGGGCFSGKDPTKVDRSAAYAARYIAKNIVAAGLADRCEVQVAYAIGHKDPVGKAIDTFGTNHRSEKVINDFAWDLIPLSVRGIIESLDLLRPIYQKTASYGHFGNPTYSWEKLV